MDRGWMRRVGLALATAVVLATVLHAAASAQRAEETRIVIAFGSAPVQASSAAAAREAAIANGLLEAVALAAMDLVSVEVFTENFKKLNELLLERPDALVQDFRVLSEAVVSRQHRVLIQATVAAKKITEAIATAGLAGTKPALGAKPLVLTVAGSGNLANFVKFRKALGAAPGVEAIQVRDMRPDETTLLVTYRGAARDLAAALAQQSFDTFTLEAVEAGEGALRLTLAPR